MPIELVICIHILYSMRHVDVYNIGWIHIGVIHSTEIAHYCFCFWELCLVSLSKVGRMTKIIILVS